MAWTQERVVLIATGKKDDLVIGTGTLIAKNRVLTASHVLRTSKHDGWEPNLYVRRHKKDGSAATEEDFVPATCCWPERYDAGHPDVAILATELEDVSQSLELDLLSRGNVKTSDWSAFGYPKVSDDEPNTGMVPVQGKNLPYESPSPELILSLTSAPRRLRGLSGAAVIIDDKIVGVISRWDDRYSNSTLWATPIARVRDDRGFIEAVGYTDEHRGIEKHLDALSAEVSKHLKDSSDFADALAKKLKVSPSEVASATVNQCGPDIAKALDQLDKDEKFKQDKRARALVRELLWKILPFARDLRGYVAAIRADDSVRGHPCPVELPLATRTGAEVVLAGVDGRKVNLAQEQSAYPKGVAQISLPAAEFAPILTREENLVEGVMRTLADHLPEENKPDARWRTGFWHDLKGRSEIDFKRNVHRELKYAAEDEPRLTCFLLFSDRDMEQGGREEVQRYWSRIVQSLGPVLPYLRLVRLTSREETDQEYDIVIPVRNIHQRSLDDG